MSRHSFRRDQGRGRYYPPRRHWSDQQDERRFSVIDKRNEREASIPRERRPKKREREVSSRHEDETKTLKRVSQWDQGSASTCITGIKGLREIFVGNLPCTEGIERLLKELLNHVMANIPEARRPAVTHVQVSESRQYAFVEFADEALASTALLFHGLTIGDRSLKIGRPGVYNDLPLGPIPALNVPKKIFEELGLSGVASSFTPASSALSLALKKQRELYFGNLVPGQTTVAILKDFITQPLQAALMSQYCPRQPVVLQVELRNGGKFAFVEFHNEATATTALHLFNRVDFYGRQLRVGRPAGYVDSSNLSSALASLNSTCRADAPLKNHNSNTLDDCLKKKKNPHAILPNLVAAAASVNVKEKAA